MKLLYILFAFFMGCDYAPTEHSHDHDHEHAHDYTYEHTHDGIVHEHEFIEHDHDYSDSEHTHDEYDNGVCVVSGNHLLCYPNVNIAECLELGETNMGLNSMWQNYTCEFLCENYLSLAYLYKLQEEAIC